MFSQWGFFPSLLSSFYSLHTLNLWSKSAPPTSPLPSSPLKPLKQYHPPVSAPSLEAHDSRLHILQWLQDPGSQVMGDTSMLMRELIHSHLYWHTGDQTFGLWILGNIMITMVISFPPANSLTARYCLAHFLLIIAIYHKIPENIWIWQTSPSYRFWQYHPAWTWWSD